MRGAALALAAAAAAQLQPNAATEQQRSSHGNELHANTCAVRLLH
jgi:hypothetical protein